MRRIQLLLVFLFASASAAVADPTTFVCAFRDANNVPTKRTFIWDAGAGLFDGHHIGETWQDGDARIELRKTDIAIVRETTRPAGDGHQVNLVTTIDDYGFYSEKLDSRMIVRGECKKAASGQEFDVPLTRKFHSSAMNIKEQPALEPRVDTAIIKLTEAATIMRSLKPKDDLDRKQLTEALAALQSAIGDLNGRPSAP